MLLYPILINGMDQDLYLSSSFESCTYSKTCLKLGAILLTFIKLPFVIKIFILSIFEWPLKIGFTVLHKGSVKTQAILCLPKVSLESSLLTLTG